MRLGNADVAHRQLEKTRKVITTTERSRYECLPCLAKASMPQRGLQQLAIFGQAPLRRAALACSKLCIELAGKDSPEAETMSRPWLKVEAALALPWPAVWQFHSGAHRCFHFFGHCHVRQRLNLSSTGGSFASHQRPARSIELQAGFRAGNGLKLLSFVKVVRAGDSQAKILLMPCPHHNTYNI